MTPAEIILWGVVALLFWALALVHDGRGRDIYGRGK